MRKIKIRGLVIEPLVSGEKWITSDEEYHEVYLNYAEHSAYINGHEVVWESVSEYTGLKDKNGKEIFEGDIVKLTNSSGFHCLAEVHFSYGCFEVVFKDPLYVREGLRGYYRERDYVKCFTCNHAIEVVGNIYENSELLKN